MTDPEPSNRDPVADAAMQQRLAELKARRSASARAAGLSTPEGAPGVTMPVDPGVRRTARRYPAITARILSTGLSSVLALGIIAALGADAATQPAEGQEVTIAQPLSSSVASASAPAAIVTELSGQPIQLTAAPAVRSVQPAPHEQPAPVVATHGSR